MRVTISSIQVDHTSVTEPVAFAAEGAATQCEESREAARGAEASPISPTDSSGSTNVDSRDCAASPVGREQFERRVKQLADMSPLHYEHAREAEAKHLGVRVSFLDEEVKKRRGDQSPVPNGVGFTQDISPWADEVAIGDVLDEICGTVMRFIVCDEHVATATALWCAFTWVTDYVQVAPIALITAPEKGCGKSQLLDLIGRLSCRPLVASNISPAAVFRVIEAHAPTLLIDEADSFMRDNEQLRGVINSGHTRQSAYVIRTVGDTHEPRQFSTWGAKAIAGIGRLAPTIMDRSIVLGLRRKLPNEHVEKLRHADDRLFERLARQLARFAQDSGRAIQIARPALPRELTDRAQDNWEALLAIADLAGGRWPDLARNAAVRLASNSSDATLSNGTELLVDIRRVFETRTQDWITTELLIGALSADEERPWRTLNNGEPISAKQLAYRLREYGIRSANIKIPSTDMVRKGYRRTDFDDAFSRYLPNEQGRADATRYPSSSAVADGAALPSRGKPDNSSQVARSA